MKRYVALILVFSLMFSLSGCAINTDALVEQLKSEVSELIDSAVDEAKDQASEAIDDAIEDVKAEVSDKIEDAKEEASQKVGEVIDGIKPDASQEAVELPKTGEEAIETPKTGNNESSWIENFLGYDMIVTFLPNGGVGGPTYQRFKDGSHVKITEEKPTREGYHFVGWTWQIGGNEPVFFAGEWTSQPFTQNTTLYACWEAYNPDDLFTVHAHTGETLNFGGVFELIGGSAGVKDITIEHNFHLIKENDGTIVRIQCDCGFELVDRELSLDNFVIIKSERVKQTFDSLEASKQEEYRQDYALYCMLEDEFLPQTGDVILGKPDGEYTIHYVAVGATNVPADHTITNKLFSSKKISKKIPEKQGYIFLGWGTTENTTEVSYEPGQKWREHKSASLYAIWEECTHKKTNGQWYGFVLSSEEILCQQCDGEPSPNSYFFSDYLKATKIQKKGNYNKLNEDELTQALEGYIKGKLHAYAAAFSNFSPIVDKNPNLIPQVLGLAHDEILLKIDEIIQLIYQDNNMYISLVNQNDSWTSYDVDNFKFSVDTFRTIMSAAGTIHSMVSFGKSYDKLNQEILEGNNNTYRIEMQKIDSGIKFAQALSNITGFFYSLAGGQTVSGLVPEPEDYKDKIKNYEYGAVSYGIWCSLQNGLYGDDFEACKQAFQSNGTENNQFVIECWPLGPTVAQTINYINQVEKVDPEALPCWFFYLGWRAEYEYACVIQKILSDQI